MPASSSRITGQQLHSRITARALRSVLFQSARRISSGRPLEEAYAYCRAVRVGDRVLISGTTALNARGEVEAPGDMYRQTRATLDTIHAALAEAGGEPGDLVYTKTYLTDVSPAATADYTRAWLDGLGDVRPVSTLLGIPGLMRPEMLIEVEVFDLAHLNRIINGLKGKSVVSKVERVFV